MTAAHAGATPGFGLFVVASPAAETRERILERARTLFDVRRVYDLRWTPELAAENYARFYRRRPGAARPSGGFDRPLLLVTAVDPSTRHERATASGSTALNTRFFDARQEFRTWMAGT